jgi:hypothetical protein
MRFPWPTEEGSECGPNPNGAFLGLPRQAVQTGLLSIIDPLKLYNDNVAFLERTGMLMDQPKSDRERIVRVHITQDDYGYWMMSFERDDGALALASSGAEHPDTRAAYHPAEIGLAPDTEFWISEPSVALRRGDPSYHRPQARRARAPYYVVKNGKRVS